MKAVYTATISLLLILATFTNLHANSATLVSTGTNPNLLPDLVDKIMPGVVNISTTTRSRAMVYGLDEYFRFWGIPQERSSNSMGSGFIIDKDGYALTNNHVIEGADEIVASFQDKRTLVGRVVGRDEKLDLALLLLKDEKTGTTPANLTAIPLGDSDKVRIAETVFAVGNPFGNGHTVTVGIISARNRNVGQGPYDHFLQTDAAINPGNSGGPLFNLQGEVIGINTAIASRIGQSSGVGFAIPTEAVKDAIPLLKRYGRIPRPWLGAFFETVTPRLARIYGLKSDKGAIIVQLVESAPAIRSGLDRGDIIQNVGGTEITDLHDLDKALNKYKPGDQIDVKIAREKRTMNMKIKLKELPQIQDLPQGVL